jgi:CheY-like chemotaxis protein
MAMEKKCFLIDDDIDDQEIFMMALEDIDMDISCVTANNGVEALKKLNSDPSFIPDYIFLDINMPKMNGIECLSEIKKLRHLSGVTIMMFSTSSDPEIISASRKLGAVDFLVKPPGLKPLVQTLAKIFKI